MALYEASINPELIMNTKVYMKDSEENNIKDVSKNIAQYIINGENLTAIMTITDTILGYGINSTAVLINKLATDKVNSISLETLCSFQSCIYLLCLKHRKMIKLGHYAQVSSFLDMEVPTFEQKMYVDIIDYYDQHPDELELLSYLFH